MYNFVISIPLFSSLFWLVFFLLSYKHADAPKRIMTCFFLATFVLYSMHFLYFSGIQNKVAETIYGIANLLVYPLFLFYLLRLTGKNISKHILLLLPAILIAITYPLFYFLQLPTAHQVMYIFARCCFALQVAYTSIFGTKLIVQFRRSLDDQFSDDRSYSLQPLFLLTILFATISLLSMLSNIIGREYFADKNIVAIPAALMSIMLYLLGFVTSQLTFADQSALPSQDFSQYNTAENSESSKSSSASPIKADDLQLLMQQSKPYLNPNLTLNELAVMLHTNRTYLSNFLHDELKMTFAAYVNMYRVEEAKKILSDKKYTSSKAALQDAILYSGFSSESSFYRIFKQITGMTPNEYKKTLTT